MLIMPSFQKSLIVEQFQGNYLKSTLDVYANSICAMLFIWLKKQQQQQQNVFYIAFTLRRKSRFAFIMIIVWSKRRAA